MQVVPCTYMSHISRAEATEMCDISDMYDIEGNVRESPTIGRLRESLIDAALQLFVAAVEYPSEDWRESERAFLALDGTRRYRGSGRRVAGDGPERQDPNDQATQWADRVIDRLRRGIITATEIARRADAVVRDTGTRVARDLFRWVGTAARAASRAARATADAARDAAREVTAPARSVGMGLAIAGVAVLLALARR